MRASSVVLRFLPALVTAAAAVLLPAAVPAVASPGATTGGTVRIGQAVCMTGHVTGLHCGTVTALNVTVSFPEGVVTGLIRTTVCAEPGDAGSPLYAGPVLVGILLGASGNCTTGGTSYFQPVP